MSPRREEGGLPLKALPGLYALSHRWSMQRQRERSPYLAKNRFPILTFDVAAAASAAASAPSYYASPQFHQPHTMTTAERLHGRALAQRIQTYPAPDDVFEHDLATAMRRANRAKL